MAMTRATVLLAIVFISQATAACVDDKSCNATATLIKYYIEEALTRWEQRIEVSGVNAWPDPGGVIRVEVSYTIRSTQEQQSLALQLSGG